MWSFMLGLAVGVSATLVVLIIIVNRIYNEYDERLTAIMRHQCDCLRHGK